MMYFIFKRLVDTNTENISDSLDKAEDFCIENIKRESGDTPIFIHHDLDNSAGINFEYDDIVMSMSNEEDLDYNYVWIITSLVRPDECKSSEKSEY